MSVEWGVIVFLVVLASLGLIVWLAVRDAQRTRGAASIDLMGHLSSHESQGTQDESQGTQEMREGPRA